MAEKVFREDPKLAARYVRLARKIGLRYNIRLSKEIKEKFCKGCNFLLFPGYSSKIWIESKRKCIAIKCLNCNRIYRKPYK